MSKVAVTSTSFSRSPVLKGELLEVCPDAVFNEDGLKLQGDQLVDFVKDAEIIVCGLEPFSKQVLDQLPQLRFISKYGVGTDSLDL